MVSTAAARTLASTNINDNTAGDVTPSDVRSVVFSVLDLIDRSAGQIATSVLEYGAVNDGTTDARAAIVSAMAGGSTFFPPGSYRVASNLTITGVVYFAPGASLKPASGVTVTFNGQIAAERTKIFDTSLGGSFATTASSSTATPITKSYPEWWGANGNGGNQSPYIQAAIDFIQGKSGGTVSLSGWYTCQSTLNISGRVRLEGAGPVYGTALVVGGVDLSTSLDFSLATANTSAIRVNNASNFVNGFQMANLGLFRNPPAAKTNTSVGLHLVAVHHVSVTDCSIFGFATGLQVEDEPNATTKASYDGIFDGCSIGGGGKSAVWLAGCAGFTFRDCTLYSGEPNLDQIVMIWRGAGGMKSDTITFMDTRIVYLGAATGRPSSLVKLLDGMWINFCRVDIEEALNFGILIERDSTASHQDIGLKMVDISNCWFNGCGTAVMFSGFRASGRISDCRIENSGGGATNIAINFSSLQDADIVIRGNNIRSSGSVGGISVANASGVRIMENYIYTADAGIALPGIVLTSTAQSTIVTGNRVRSNHAAPINNAGTGNVIANNITSA